MKHLTRIILISIAISQMVFAQADYREIHQQAFVVDTHADVLLRVLSGADISKRLDTGHIDLIRLREGGVDMQVFALWSNPEKYRPVGMYDQTNRLIDALEKIEKDHPDMIRIIRTAEEAEQASREGKLAAFIGGEGGPMIENDLAKLQHLYNRGMRYMGLTWNDSPDWAGSAKDEMSPEYTGARGLTDFGKEVIRKMDGLGMIVDVSHSSEKTFWDVVAVSKKPIIASHSCVWNLNPHYRNLKDEQIKKIAEKGGAVFINFYAGYLQKGFEKKYSAIQDESAALMDSMRQVYADNSLAYRQFRNNYMKEKVDAFRPDVEVLVDHVDYIVNLVGDDYVGLGSDFDGISITPKGIEDVTDMLKITKSMQARGYSAERIQKILGGNFMRIFRAVSEK
ncbi:MAG: membrane dipeptidase [Calditrichales bacterium]|nr:MAG: membrane dipeptidase [Calditrichales bacterium]